MPYSGADASMPSFLFIATVANFVFIGRSVRDCTSKKSPVSKPTAVSLLLTAVAESIWVLPCCPAQRATACVCEPSGAGSHHHSIAWFSDGHGCRVP